MPDVQKLHAYTIRRTYYRNSKYSLQMFIPPVETIYSTGNYNVNPNAILYFSLPWRKGDTKALGRSFSIHQWNQRRVLRTLGEALSWFRTIEDLYAKSADGTLYFNTAYNSLVARYSPGYYENPQALKIVPIAMEVGNETYTEGVRLYMNRLENFMELTLEELQTLFDIIDGFDFATETILSYQALAMSFNMSNMKSLTDHQNALIPK